MIYLWNTKAEDSKTGRVQRSLLISFDHMVTMPECRNGLRPDERKWALLSRDKVQSRAESVARDFFHFTVAQLVLYFKTVEMVKFLSWAAID